MVRDPGRRACKPVTFTAGERVLAEISLREGRSSMHESVDTATSQQGPRKPRLRTLICALLLFLIGTACGPWIVSKTALCDQVISLVIGEPHLEVSSTSASFGWWTPLTVAGLELRNSEGDVVVTIDQLQAERSWFALWLSRPELGQFAVQRPQIEITLTDDIAAQPPAESDFDPSTLPFLSAEITDARLVVRVEGESEPAVDLDEFDITLHIEEGSSGPVLSVDPLTILDRQPLSPELCNSGIQLVAPMLADEVSVAGELSLELKRLRVPLDPQDSEQERREMELQGLLVLHHVVGGIENPITKGFARMAADLLGLGELPERVRLADQASIGFHIRDGRLHHQSTTLAFPEISPDLAVRTSGSVGFDESLDLRVELQIPQDLLAPTALATALAQAPITLQVTGTLDEPRLGLPADQTWVARLSDRLLSSEASSEEGPLAGQIMTMVGKLLEESNGEQVPIGSRLRERLEQRRAQRGAADDERPTNRGTLRERLQERRARRTQRE